MNPSSLFTDRGKYQGELYRRDIFPLENYKDLPKIELVHALCFLNLKQMVFCINKNGELGIPGGETEEGESVEDTIRRELIEEAQLKLINWKTIGYELIYYPNKPTNKNKSYFLRVVAKVELIDAEVNDPCGKAVGRKVVLTETAAKKLNWGKKGEVLINLAREKYLQVWDIE